MDMTTLIAVDYDEIKTLQQALALSRDLIAEIAQECHEDPAQAMREVDDLQAKLNDAFKVIHMRMEILALEQNLKEPDGHSYCRLDP